MKKFSLLVGCCISIAASAQKKIPFETVFFEDAIVETATLKVNVTGALSEFDVIKSKLTVNNFGNKTIVIKPAECYFTTHQGNIFSKDRWIVVPPRDKESKVIDVKTDNIKCDTTTLHLNGIYICNEQNIFLGTEISVPPPKEVTVGKFKMELDGFDRDGKEIMIKYKVRYIGDQIGMVIPSKVTLKSPDGAEFKNMKEKDKTHVFTKNEDILIGFLYVSDSKKENKMFWNEAFSESTPEKTDNLSIPLKMDPVKTKDKN